MSEHSLSCLLGKKVLAWVLEFSNVVAKNPNWPLATRRSEAVWSQAQLLQVLCQGISKEGWTYKFWWQMRWTCVVSGTILLLAPSGPTSVLDVREKGMIPMEQGSGPLDKRWFPHLLPRLRLSSLTPWQTMVPTTSSQIPTWLDSPWHSDLSLRATFLWNPLLANQSKVAATYHPLFSPERSNHCQKWILV